MNSTTIAVGPRIVIDLDNTLTIDEEGADYLSKAPNLTVIEKLREYKLLGYTISIHTSRNMRTYSGNVGLINLHTLPVIIQWLDKHNVPYDEIFVGKPWCGQNGFYVDDRALRPDEFCRLTQEEVSLLLQLPAAQ